MKTPPSCYQLHCGCIVTDYAEPGQPRLLLAVEPCRQALATWFAMQRAKASGKPGSPGLQAFRHHMAAGWSNRICRPRPVAWNWKRNSRKNSSWWWPR